MAEESSRPLYKNLQRRIIGSLLQDSSSVSVVLELITEDDIEEPDLGLIFSAIADLSRADKNISPITVAEILEKNGNLKAVGGTSGLYKLFMEGEKYLLDASPEIYARIIKESSVKSKTSKILTDFKDKFTDDSGFQASDAIAELQSDLNEKLLKLSNSSTIFDVTKVSDDYLKILDERREVSENSDVDGLQGIPSLLPSLNKYTTGWMPGQIITVGAKTGIGKSIFAVNCAVAAAMAGKTVLFFSLEMSEKELMDRIYSSTAQIPLNTLKLGTLSSEELQKLKDQMDSMKDVHIVIDSEPKQTVDSIRARALRQAQTKEGLDFILIDYLQLVKASGRFNNRQEAVADISRNTKLLAKQLGVPVMVLVQLNKGNKDEDASAVPNMDMIRESAAIAMDSDIVLLLHREINNENDGTTPLTSVILEKQRGGVAHKTIRCHSNLEYSLFREIKTSKNAEFNEDINEIDNSDEMIEDEFSDDDIVGDGEILEEELDFSDFGE